jgi:hypothetical protein
MGRRSVRRTIKRGVRQAKREFLQRDVRGRKGANPRVPLKTLVKAKAGVKLSNREVLDLSRASGRYRAAVGRSGTAAKASRKWQADMLRRQRGKRK